MGSVLQDDQLRGTVENREVDFGVIDVLYRPALVELIGEMGFDFVWLEFEHGDPSPFDGGRLEDLLWAADAVGERMGSRHERYGSAGD